MRPKGWFVLPGVQHGDRTLEEQLRGLERARDLAAGGSLLDLGCAEGLIALAFAAAGAAPVTAIECNPDSLAIARAQPGAGAVDFREGNLNRLLSTGELAPHDTVLALAILHKLHDPAVATRQVAALARKHLVVRLPAGSDGVIGSKFYRERRCDTRGVLEQCGFVLEAEASGPRDERVHYWRRAA